MNIFARTRSIVSLGAAAVVFAACGGSNATLGVPLSQAAQRQSPSAPVYRVLHTFGGSGDGVNPSAGLIVANGTMYGTTSAGGAYDAGTVFAIAKNGKETVLHSFGAPGDGAFPVAALIDVAGVLYGTTSQGGAYQCGGYTCGTVFSITTRGKETVVYSFGKDTGDGALPYASLLYVDGTFYGTTLQGGAPTCHSYSGPYCGTVFSVTAAGSEKVLHRFGKSNDGIYPHSALTDVGATLYGTTTSGGKYGRGTVYIISQSGKEQVLYDFGTTGYHDGTRPLSGLTNAGGTLYGTTSRGGNASGGSVFSITKFGKFRLLYSFDGGTGSWPFAGLIDVKGTLYGTTSQGGTHNTGTVFSLTKLGAETVLHSFGNGNDKSPVANLLEAGGTLYGTTPGAYPNDPGTVFSLTP